MAKTRPQRDLLGAKADNPTPKSEKPLNEASTIPGGMADDLTFMKMNEMANSIPQRAENELRMLEGYKAQEERQKLTQKIGEKEVREAAEILRKYKAGKARLEAKIIANEEYWKLRQWNYEQKPNEAKGYKPATAWLWSCIASRHADMMDSYPTCNFLARQQDDKGEAKMLSAVIPVVLEQNRYEETYSDIAWYLLKNGGCVQAVLWDGTKHNGLGDISIKKIDILNIFWEPGITDIQKSENVFTVELVSNKKLEQRYPQTRGRLTQKDITVAKYLYDENVNTEDKSVVVDWYYKTEYEGRKAVHYCKFVNGIVLYATENETAQPMSQQMDMLTGIPVLIPNGEPMSVRGLYDHAMYPFVFQDLYPIEDSIIGYGLTETAPLVCDAAPRKTKVGSTGRPSHGVQVKLINVNPDTGEGELVVKGDCLMRGYYKDFSRTNEVITPDGWFHTGDYATCDRRGRYYIKGRKGNMILGASGENIYPEEIECVINSMEGVNESLVVERDGQLVALVHYNENVLDWNFESEEKFLKNLEERKKAILDYVNSHVNKNSHINEVKVQKQPFIKTATKKIKRFRYKDGDNAENEK